MVTLLHLTGLERRLPRQLSGGQQQRVALGRALAVRPQLLLLDEPFAALDRGLRLEMQIELKRLQRQLGISTILVTHDQEEALSLADRIAVMNAGAIEQFASPSEIYTAPVSAFVNSFIGTTNFLAVRIDGAAGDLLQLSLPSGTVLPVVCGGPWRERGEARLSIRPEQFMLTTAVGLLSGTVSQVLPLGASTLVQVALDDGSHVKVMVPTALGEPVPQTGAKTGLAIRGGAVLRAYPP
jgi:putative spermidine/putrescine transport system ATP-binding protein